MQGNRFRLKQQLEKERLELDKRREEEDMRTRRENMVIQSSTNMEVPQRQDNQPEPVEVPQTILEVHVHIIFHCINAGFKYMPGPF